MEFQRLTLSVFYQHSIEFTMCFKLEITVLIFVCDVKARLGCSYCVVVKEPITQEAKKTDFYNELLNVYQINTFLSTTNMHAILCNTTMI